MNLPILNQQPSEGLQQSHRGGGMLDVVEIFPEKWRYVVGSKKLYMVSTHGRAKSLPRKILRADGQTYTVRGKILKLVPHGEKGYLCFSVCDNGKQKFVLIHDAVLRAFRGPPEPGEESCHFPDRDVTNNHLINLRWGTPKDNARDRDKHGKTARWEKNGCAVLNRKQVREIRRRRGNGESLKSIAFRFKITAGHVCNLYAERKWKAL